MPDVSLRVDLLAMTPDAEALISAAARQCYSPNEAYGLFNHAKRMEEDGPTQDMHNLIRSVVASGHESVVEHVSFTFAVAGVSRALSHQLVRHRLASYSQQSQRYVGASGFNYVLPPSIAHKHDALFKFEHAMAVAATIYDQLVTDYGIPAEDARFVLPNACETKLVVTMNCRSLLHFFELRCCNRAQWEIRALADAMLAVCQEKLPVVFEGRGAKCLQLGYCPEAKGCGRMEKRPC